MREIAPTPPERSDGPGISTVAIGLVLILIGAALFAAQMLGIGIEDIGWPFLVIAAGVAILVIGLVVMNEQGMVIGGTVVTTLGLVLLFQDRTGRWESWAYAWALVGPAASGLGLRCGPFAAGIPAICAMGYGACSPGSPSSRSASCSSRG